MNTTNTPDCGVDCKSNLKKETPKTLTFSASDTEIPEEWQKAIEMMAERWRKEVDEQILKDILSGEITKENKK